MQHPFRHAAAAAAAVSTEASALLPVLRLPLCMLLLVFVNVCVSSQAQKDGAVQAEVSAQILLLLRSLGIGCLPSH